jgi:hypothetical protein
VPTAFRVSESHFSRKHRVFGPEMARVCPLSAELWIQDGRVTDHVFVFGASDCIAVCVHRVYVDLRCSKHRSGSLGTSPVASGATASSPLR